MPKRTDLRKILIVGSGPIIIGQACEFDYSGTQACKALREEGYEVVLVNSNPATIMTDPDIATRTYVEPITPEGLEKIIAIERPDAMLPTVGGQTGLNCAFETSRLGILEKYNVEMIGATMEAIFKAEDRDAFRKAMNNIGVKLPPSGYAESVEDAREAVKRIGLPCVVRASFALGGAGSAFIYNEDEIEPLVSKALSLSLTGSALIEKSIYGWKEFELEVMRDTKDNVVIVCSIENFDPMGVHTGDSITVAPAQTLSDKEYQRMRDQAIAIIREIGVDTGGSNIQFAQNPVDGELVVIEMNPRVSRSSALASKATGFPIAKIAAKLAVGYTLDELRNDITRETPSSFEPTIDYCVVKMPRWAFEKFPDADDTLTTQMKSVGETMAIGRTFVEAMQKAVQGLEIGRFGVGADPKDEDIRAGGGPDEANICALLKKPNMDRVFVIRHAFKAGFSAERICDLTKIDPWFIDQFARMVEMEDDLAEVASLDKADKECLYEAKRFGFSDRQLATLWKTDEMSVRSRRKELGVTPSFKLVDTCAAEFEAYTPYYYSTYEEEDEVRVSDKKKIMILGGGPNRIGQGIEFDYCCVQAAFAVKDLGYESIMVNSNPETVSTDYDTSDLLFFEPLTIEHVLNICDRQKPAGVIVQFGGQTPLNLAAELEKAGVPIIGTPVASLDRAEDREQFNVMIKKLAIRQPAGSTTTTVEGAVAAAAKIGYPVLVRPSRVLGGQYMAIIYNDDEMRTHTALCIEKLRAIGEGSLSDDAPLLIDKFLDNAIEVDVDAICDGTHVIIGGIMEHIEAAGVHSGDSACVLPPVMLSEYVQESLRNYTRAIAKELKVIGLVNIQYAVKGNKIYVIEVNPRASRTIPFVSKAIGKPLARMAAKVMIGETLESMGFTKEIIPPYRSVKEVVLPWNKFPGNDIVLGPEMKSTGEVMGIDEDFGLAFAKAQMATGQPTTPLGGCVFISVNSHDKQFIGPIAQEFQRLGFDILTTKGTGAKLDGAGVAHRVISKIQEKKDDNIITRMVRGEIALLLNTPSARGPRTDEAAIRQESVLRGVPIITTIAGGMAAVKSIGALQKSGWDVKALQDYHAMV